MSLDGLGPDARALLDAAEGGDEPSAADAARVRRKLASQLALGVAAGTAAATMSKSAGGATAASAAGAAAGGAAAVPMTSLLSAKVLVAVALLGGATATGAVVMHERAPVAMVASANANANEALPSASANRRAIPSVAEVTPAAPAIAATTAMTATTTTTSEAPAPAIAKAVEATPAAPQMTERVAEKRVETVTAAATSTPRANMAAATDARSAAGAGAGRLSAPTRSAPTLSAPTDSAPTDFAPTGSAPVASAAARASTPPRDTVAEEAALLRAANAALARGDAATALARIDDHAARFPRGALVEEREAARVLALCAAGRATESRAAAGRFVSANPRSPFVAQVRRACTTP